MRRAGPELSAIVAECLMAGPASLAKVCIALGVPTQRSSDTAKPYVMAFKDRGLVYIADWYRGAWPMYGWQPAPFALPDVPRPVKATKPRAVVLIPQKPASAFTWGRS